MMREKISLLLVFSGIFLVIGRLVFASNIETDSRIAQVTVYADSALVSRKAQLKLGRGQQRVVFSGIIPEIDEDSLRVSFRGEAKVKLFGAELKREFLQDDPSQRIKQLNAQIKELEGQRKRLEYDKEILNKEKQFLDSVRLFSEGQIPKDLVTKTPLPQDLDGILRFLDGKWKENYAGYLEYEFKTRDIVDKIDLLRRELSIVSGPSQKLKRHIEVAMEVVNPGAGELVVSYLVRGASWYPVYEARADFEKSEVELVSNAIVRQNTGEDWQEVEMTLSTAKPLRGGSLPEVSPWLLRPYQPLLRVSSHKQRNREEMSMQAAKSISVDDRAIEPEEDTLQYSQTQEKGVALNYVLNKKVSVKADGSQQKLLISSQSLKADFEYSSYPRKAPMAYLGSRIINPPESQLLPGRVNVFLDGDFTGTSDISAVGPSEEFDLYLGIDDNVKVKREQIEKKVDETLIGNIASFSRKTIFRQKLTLENYKSKKIKVKLLESMPVSEDERIKVKMGLISLEPKEKDWQDRKGVWLWELELEPRAKQEIFYSYTIEHPRNMQVEGL